MRMLTPWDPGLGTQDPRKGPRSQGPRGARGPFGPLGQGPMGPVGVIPRLFRMGVILREASVGVHLQSKEQTTNLEVGEKPLPLPVA